MDTWPYWHEPSLRSSSTLGGSESGPFGPSLVTLLIDWIVIESGHSWLHIMSLSHIEVLSEVLISAPPICMNHACLLISSDLMEVRVSNVVLLSISWESSIRMWSGIPLVDLTNVPFPLGDHWLFLLFGKEIQNEWLIEVPDEENVYNSDSILITESCDFPEGISKWIFEESCDILEGSPFLGHVSWLSSFGDELCEITIGLFDKSSINWLTSS